MLSEEEREIAIARDRETTAQYFSNSLASKISLPKLYPLQQQIKSEAARFNVICLGRRAGKTYLSVHLLLETALAGYPAGWFTPEHKDALEVWAQLDRTLRGVATKINASEKRIELPNGGVIECWTMEHNEDAGRSRKYKRVIIDEAAKAPLLKKAWQEAIRPTLTDYQGDAWFPSTPKGLNYFFELYQKGVDPLDTLWKAWQLPSKVNPFLPLGEIDIAQADSPELVFQQEYLAEFISSDGAVFRNVDAVLTSRPATPRAHSGHVVVAGVDLAQKHDFTACSIYCVTCNREVYLDRWNKLGWEFQRGRLLQLLLLWKVQYALIELNSIGGPNFEALYALAPRELSLAGFETTSKTKPGLIQQTALEVEREACSFLPDAVGKFELLAYECELTAVGYPKYGAPEGGYDDTVIARCLAIEAKRRNPLPPETAFARAIKQYREEVQETVAVTAGFRTFDNDYHQREAAAKADRLAEIQDAIEMEESSAWERAWDGLQ